MLKEKFFKRRENKRIIPCFYSYITDKDVKWNLNSYQGIEFDDKYDLVLKLYSKIEDSDISGENSKTNYTILKERNNYYKQYGEAQRKKKKSDYKGDEQCLGAPLKYNEPVQAKEIPSGFLSKLLRVFKKDSKSYLSYSNYKIRKIKEKYDRINTNKEKEQKIHDYLFDIKASKKGREPKPIPSNGDRRPDTGDKRTSEVLTGSFSTTERQPVNKRNTIERYPLARFPEKILLNDIVPLEVLVKAIKPENNPNQFYTSLELITQSEDKEIPVLVIIENSKGLELQNSEYYTTINVPSKLKDSKPIIFKIKGKEEGLQSIELRFFQETTCIGNIKIDTEVILSKEILPKTSKEYKLNNLLNKIIQAPDISLIIYEKDKSNLEYDILVSSYDMPMQKIDQIRFPFNPEQQFYKIFDEIENSNQSPKEIDRKIKVKGMRLYEELFPENLKNFYWDKKDKIKSIRVLTREPWIPWEIIKPYRKKEDGNIEEDDFLCEKYSFSRWFINKSENPKEHLRKIKVIVPSDTDLKGATKERDWLKEFFESKGLDISVDSTSELFNTLETGRYDLLHFSTHGKHNRENPLSSSLDLQEGFLFKPEDIIGEAMNFGKANPIIILNGCQTGNQGFSLTGIQGWATSFIDAGACIFIGTLWSVSDDTAFEFVKEVYNQMSNNVLLGEAIRMARNKCKKEGDPSWLAYQLYGHPNAEITIGN